MSRLQTVRENWADITTKLLRDKQELAHFLRFSAKMYKQSFSDSVLIYQQNPNATKVATLETWNKLGRLVNKGEHSIAVFGEDSKCKHLFDISQTNGKRVPELWKVDENTITAGTAGVLTGKLLQLCNGAIYDENKVPVAVHDCKIDAFMELIEQLNGQHALVFYNFQHDRERLLAALADTKLRVRVYSQARDEADWNNGEIDVLLAHPASCGYGLNLQRGGHHAIWFGLTWSLEQYEQANKRLHRQGQESYGLSLSFAGMLGGSLMTVLAASGNLVIMIYNIVAEVIISVWNIIGEFVNFFANVWTDPLGSVVRLFVGVFDAILSIIETVIGAIGSLFGQDWSSGIQGFRDDMNAAVEQQFGTGAVDVTVDEKMISLDYINYDDAFDAGYYLADNAFGTDSSSDVNVYQMPEVPEVPGIDEIAANTDSIDDKLETTEEELKYLRDLAEQETVNRFTTAEIIIDQSGMQNIVNSSMDLDGVVDGLTDAVNEAVDIIAEGGYDC